MNWWKSLFRKDALDAQLDSELRFHIEKLTNDNIAAGMKPEEARRQAVLEFGGREQIKEELRDVHRVSVIETMMANFKSAFRLPIHPEISHFLGHGDPHPRSRHRRQQRRLLRHRRDSAATIAFPQRRPTDAPRSVQPQG